MHNETCPPRGIKSLEMFLRRENKTLKVDNFVFAELRAHFHVRPFITTPYINKKTNGQYSGILLVCVALRLQCHFTTVDEHFIVYTFYKL